MVSHELTAYFSVFDLLLTQWIMTILSKGCKADGFQSHGSLKLSFTSIQVLCLNFVECKFFLESNSPDILALCEKLGWLNWFWQFLNEGFLPLHRKDSATHAWSCSSCEGRTSFCTRLTLENSVDSCVCFQMVSLHSVSYFFFLYQSPSWPLCTVFDAISSKIHEVLSVNPSTVFVFAWYEEVSPIIQGFRISLFSLSVS